jgi:hypothetical protein
MRTRLTFSLTLVFVGLSVAAAPPQHPAPARYVIGTWSNEDGSLVLELTADRQVRLTLASRNPKEPSEMRFGSFALKDRLWKATVTDLSHRNQVFSIAPLDGNQLNLVRSDGVTMHCQRVGMRLNALDRNFDGLLSAEEVQGTRMAIQFLSLDLNRDGMLSPTEFVQFWKHNPPPLR